MKVIGCVREWVECPLTELKSDQNQIILSNKENPTEKWQKLFFGDHKRFYSLKITDLNTQH